MIRIAGFASAVLLSLLISASGAGCSSNEPENETNSVPTDPNAEGGTTPVDASSDAKTPDLSSDGKAPENDGAATTKPGALDESFGTGGIFSFPTFGDGEILFVAERAGGYVFAGMAHGNARDALQLGAVDSSGALDTTFGTGGRTIVKPGTDFVSDEPFQLLALPDSGWLVAGRVEGEPSLVRFDASGRLTTFGTGGVAHPPVESGVGDSLGAIRLDNGSFIALIKHRGAHETYQFREFNAAGVSVDTPHPAVDAIFFANTFEAKSGGAIWVMGGAGSAINDSESFVTRYFPPGEFSTYHSSSNPIGIFVGPYASIDGLVDTGPKVMILVGHPNASDRLAQFDTATGAPDKMFGHDGTVELASPKSNSTSRRLLAVDGSGRAIVSFGDDSNIDTLVRYDAAGKPDGSFGPLSIPFSVQGARIDSAGRLVVVGTQLDARHGDSMRIARIGL